MSTDLDKELLLAIKSSNMTQAEVAEKSGLSLGSLKQMIQRKKFKAKELGRIAEAIGFKVLLVKESEEDKAGKKVLKNKLIAEVSDTINRVFNDDDK